MWSVLLIKKDTVVNRRIMREYNKFTYHMLKNSKKRIMDKSTMIQFYGCIKEYFECNACIPACYYEALFDVKEHDIIHELWEVYLKYEQLRCMTWDDIDELIEFWIGTKAA